MFETFKVRNIFVPKTKQMLWGIACWVMFFLGFSLILYPFFDLDTPNGVYWYQISNFCASFILTSICFLPFLRESIAVTNFRNLPLQVLIGYGIEFVMAYAVTIALFFVRRALGEESVNVNQETVEALVHQNPLPMLICTCFLVPITEECLARGMIFAPICKESPFWAYLLSTLVFSGLHVLASIGEASVYNIIELLLTYLPSGIALGWMYQRSGTIIGSIALHCVMNMFSMIYILLLF